MFNAVSPPAVNPHYAEVRTAVPVDYFAGLSLSVPGLEQSNPSLNLLAANGGAAGAASNPKATPKRQNAAQLSNGHFSSIEDFLELKSLWGVLNADQFDYYALMGNLNRIPVKQMRRIKVAYEGPEFESSRRVLAQRYQLPLRHSLHDAALAALRTVEVDKEQEYYLDAWLYGASLRRSAEFLFEAERRAKYSIRRNPDEESPYLIDARFATLALAGLDPKARDLAISCAPFVQIFRDYDDLLEAAKYPPPPPPPPSPIEKFVSYIQRLLDGERSKVVEPPTPPERGELSDVMFANIARRLVSSGFQDPGLIRGLTPRQLSRVTDELWRLAFRGEIRGVALHTGQYRDLRLQRPRYSFAPEDLFNQELGFIHRQIAPAQSLVDSARVEGERLQGILEEFESGGFVQFVEMEAKCRRALPNSPYKDRVRAASKFVVEGQQLLSEFEQIEPARIDSTLSIRGQLMDAIAADTESATSRRIALAQQLSAEFRDVNARSRIFLRRRDQALGEMSVVTEGQVLKALYNADWEGMAMFLTTDSRFPGNRKRFYNDPRYQTLHARLDTLGVVGSRRERFFEGWRAVHNRNHRGFFHRVLRGLHLVNS